MTNDYVVHSKERFDGKHYGVIYFKRNNIADEYYTPVFKSKKALSTYCKKAILRLRKGIVI